jgi:hypothetical protein
MRKSVIGLVQIAFVIGTIAAMAVPAEAHWRHRAWHHVRGPSYYPIYGFFDTHRYGPVCVWHREWDAYWHRDCF